MSDGEPGRMTDSPLTENHSAIMVMKSAEDGRRLDGAMDRSVLVERPMRPQLVIIGGNLRQDSA